MLIKKTQLAAKIEDNEGVVETLTAADAKLLAYNPEISQDPQLFDRNPALSSFSKLGKRLGARPCALTTSLELRGSGAKNTDTEWLKLIKACGIKKSTLNSISIGAITTGPFVHGEIISGGTSNAQGRVMVNTATGTTTLYYVPIGTVAFQSAEVITGATSGATATTSSTPSIAGQAFEPVSDNDLISTLTMAGYEDGIRKLLRGCRGNLKLNASKVGEPVMMEFNFNGLYAALATVSLLTGIAHEPQKPPVFYNTGFTVDSFAAKIHQFDLDLANTLGPREDASDETIDGILSYLITDRNPVISFTVEMVAIASYDFYGKMYGEIELPVNFALGSVTGNKYRFFAPKFQITRIENVDKDGIRCIKCSGPLNTILNLDDIEFALLQL